MYDVEYWRIEDLKGWVIWKWQCAVLWQEDFNFAFIFKFLLMFILAVTVLVWHEVVSCVVWFGFFRLKPDGNLVCTCRLVFIWLIRKASLPWFSFQQQQMIRKKRVKKVVCKSLIIFFWRKDFRSLFFFFKKKGYIIELKRYAFCLLKSFFFEEKDYII